MIIITEQNRILKYREASELIRTLYTSDKVSEIVENNHPEHDNRETYQIIGDTILGFHKTSELPVLLQKEAGVSADDAMRIFGDLKEFLAPVIAREKGEVNPNHAELQELQQTFTPVTPAIPAGGVPPVPNQTAPTASEPHSPVQAMRTMEGDMNRVHGYGAYRAQFPEEAQEVENTEEVLRSASQEDILKEKPKLAGMPTYEEEGQ